MEPIVIDSTHFRINAPSPLINFNFFGCGGTGVKNNDPATTPQYKVGAALAKQTQALFTCNLGDMFYATSFFPNDGISSRRDDKFIGSFQVPYKDVENPFFGIAGNHEYGFHNTKRYTKGAAASLNNVFRLLPPVKRVADDFLNSLIQTGATLADNLFNNEYNQILEERQLKGPKLHIGNKGYYVISIYTPLDKDNPAINIYMLNSNIFDKDTEQQEWLKRELDDSTADKNIIFQHHPVATYNKLYFKQDDTVCYGYDNDKLINHRIPAIREHFRNTKYRNYNDLWALLLIDALGDSIKKVDLIGAAHAHQEALSTLNDHPLFEKLGLTKKLNQFIVGSGGGDLQHFTWFGHQPHYFSKSFGFVNFEYDAHKKTYQAKYISDDNVLQTQFNFDQDNTPHEDFNVTKKNKLWINVQKGLSLALKEIYKYDRHVHLSENFTDLLENILFVAGNNSPFTLDIIKKITIKDMINKAKDKSEDEAVLLKLCTFLLPEIEVKLDDAAEYYAKMVELAPQKFPENHKLDIFQKIKLTIINFILSMPDTLLNNHFKTQLQNIVDEIAKTNNELVILNQINGRASSLEHIDLRFKLQEVLRTKQDSFKPTALASTFNHSAPQNLSGGGSSSVQSLYSMLRRHVTTPPPEQKTEQDSVFHFN